MISEAQIDIVDLPGAAVDPFGARPEWGSRVAGLGGEQARDDFGYVFKARAVQPPLGYARFLVHFENLAATHGNLLVEVRAVSAFPGATESPLHTFPFALAEMAQTGAPVEIPFVCRRNTRYIIAASINDDTDITCTGLIVTLNADTDHREPRRAWGEGRDVASATPALMPRRITTHIATLDAQDIDEPVSQVCTEAQFQGQEFMSLVRSLKLESEPAAEAWKQAFVLHVLSHYGVLTARASGLAILAEGQAIPSYLAARGCEVLVAGPLLRGGELADPGFALERLHRGDICEHAPFYDHVHMTRCNLMDFPESFAGKFDFLWSIDAHLHFAQDQLEFLILSSVSLLKSEGLAVHVFDYAETALALAGSPTALDRTQIERMVIKALSHLNDVAQLKFRHVNFGVVTNGPRSFGLIIRRGREG